MATNFKINNVDIDETYETFETSVAEQYGVTDSKFTDSTAKFKKNGQPLKTAIGKTFPTSAGTHLGGSNTCTQYKVNGQPIDVALKGCRPIGIPLATLSEGTHYVNRVNGETWLSTSANSATGTRLKYNPKYIFVEIQGGGGGGAGSSGVWCSGGGGGGGYAFTGIALPENSYVRIVVGAAGPRGENRKDGENGGTSYLYDANGSIILQANGGGKGRKTDDGQGTPGVYSGGTGLNGGYGAVKKENGGGTTSTTLTYDKPEGTTFVRGGKSGGTTGGNNYGGGGGASAFANGANGDSRKKPSSPGIQGSGGAGAGFTAGQANPGSHGGEGLANIYY